MVTSPRRRVGQILECQTHVLRGLRKEQQSRSSRGSVALLAALSVWATAYRLNSGGELVISDIIVQGKRKGVDVPPTTQ